MGKKKGKGGGSTHSKSNTTDGDATYYNLQPPSRTSHSNHSNDGQGQSQGQGHHASKPVGVQSTNTTVDSSSSSSSSSSTTSSDSDSVGGHLALVPRPPAFNPYMMGMPPGGFPGPYGMPPGYGSPGSGMGGGQMMLPASAGMMGPVMGGAMMSQGPGGGMGGMGPPARYLPHDDPHLMEERMQHIHLTKNPLIMEHPSLRQFVIFMAILFLLALVALIVTSIYFGRTTETSWKI